MISLKNNYNIGQFILKMKKNKKKLSSCSPPHVIT